jgi:biopolymer transport protein ExbB/TolQ
MLLLLQAAPLPGWVGPTIAISVAIMATACIVVFAAAAFAAIALEKRLDAMSDNLSGLRQDLAGMVEGARRLTEEGESLVALVREEGEAYVKTSRRFRQRLDRGIDRLSERAADLDALYEVVHEEVEDTALRFATVLRTARLSTSIVGRVLRRRRRR